MISADTPSPIWRIALSIAVLAAAAIAAWYWLTGAAPDRPRWQGYAEADFVKVGPTQQGLLTRVSVARGDQVTVGAALFDQDDTADMAALEQSRRQLKQAEGQLGNLRASGKPTEIQQAAANLLDAEASRDKIQTDLRRAEALLKTGSATQQSVDQQRADLRSAMAKVAALQAMVEQMNAPMGREGEIAAQVSAVEAARAAVSMIRWRVDQRHVRAPVAGVVADVIARAGETVPAGGPVVSLLPPGNIFVRFFVPEAMLATVRRGDPVALSCDRCPAGLTGIVSFISPEAEFTPPVIYSESSKSKLVYLVEARASSDTPLSLNPGEPVTVGPAAAVARP